MACYNLDHALHYRSRLLLTHTFDSPSPRNIIFATQGSTTPANLQATTRQTRSQSQTAPALTGSTAAASVSALPALTADEAKQYIVAPELVDATDRKMMTLILHTITCPAARRFCALTSNGSS
eukprot:5300709-Pleurochrysis_carterae.AAC.2